MADTLCRPTEGTPDMDLEAIMNTYGDRVYRLCVLYLGNHGMAEDAFQETMVKCWKYLPDYRGEASVYTWLHRIAINVCHDMMRSGWFRMWKKSAPEEILLDMPDDAENEDTDVRDAVLGLPGMYREVIVLHYYEDMTTKEIGKLLHVSENTASSRLRRARLMLEKKLKEGGNYEG